MKLHPATEKSLEFVGAEYNDLKGFYEVAKENLKTLGEWRNSLGARVDEMASEINSKVQHSYFFNVKLINEAELVEAGSPDTTELCVCIFDAVVCNITINDIDITHWVPAWSTLGGPKPIICRFVRRLVRDVKSRRREIS